MLWLKKSKTIEQHMEQSSIEVLELKSKTNKSVKQAQRDIKTLNDLLKADGITLKIHIATRSK